MKTIYLAGGCFWGLQKFFDQFEGVRETECGYANGKTENPSYEEVRYEGTGHTETVKVVFDEEKLSLFKLLEFYFMVIDPVSVNRQGNDVGANYRTGIYYEDESLKEMVDIVYNEVQRNYDTPLAVEKGKLQNYYPAEEYHQKYLDKNPAGYCHIPAAYFHLTGK